MANDLNFLDIKIRAKNNTDPTVGGVSISQVIDSDGVLGCDFGVAFELLPLDYTSETDKVFIVASDGWSKELSRVGDWFRYTVSPMDFNTQDTGPSKTPILKDCHLAFERSASGARTSLKSKAFVASVYKERRFTPYIITGCVGWYDPYDLSSFVAPAAVTSWSDKSKSSNDFDISTVDPLKGYLPNDCPCVDFATAGAKMLQTTRALFNAPCTIFVVLRYSGTSDATFRKALNLGTTFPVRLGLDSTNIIAKVNATSTTLAKGTRAADGTAFVAMVQYDKVNLVVQVNDVGTGGTGATATTACTDVTTAGKLTLGADGGVDAFGDFQVGDCVVYNIATLTTDQKQQIVRALCYKNGITP